MKYYSFAFVGLTLLSGCSDAMVFGGNIALAIAPITMLFLTINFKKF